jgi:hypothetical protein
MTDDTDRKGEREHGGLGPANCATSPVFPEPDNAGADFAKRRGSCWATDSGSASAHHRFFVTCPVSPRRHAGSTRITFRSRPKRWIPQRGCLGEDSADFLAEKQTHDRARGVPGHRIGHRSSPWGPRVRNLRCESVSKRQRCVQDHRSGGRREPRDLPAGDRRQPRSQTNTNFPLTFLFDGRLTKFGQS